MNGNLFDLTVEGPGVPEREIRVAGNGTFVIPDLEPGEYTLKAEGFSANRTRKCEVNGIHPTDPAKKTTITLQVQ